MGTPQQSASLMAAVHSSIAVLRRPDDPPRMDRDLIIETLEECARELQLVPAPLPAVVILPLAEVERRAIVGALRASQGVKTHAAVRLGISERVLRYKIQRLGVDGGQVESPTPVLP